MQSTQFTNSIHELWELQGGEVNKNVDARAKCTQASAFATSLQPWMQFSVSSLELLTTTEEVGLLVVAQRVREPPLVDMVDEICGHLVADDETFRLTVIGQDDDQADHVGVAGQLHEENVVDLVDAVPESVTVGDGQLDGVELRARTPEVGNLVDGAQVLDEERKGHDYSLGCVRNRLNGLTGDWKQAHEWLLELISNHSKEPGYLTENL